MSCSITLTISWAPELFPVLFMGMDGKSSHSLWERKDNMARIKTTKERRVQTNVGLSPTALEAAEWMVEHQGYTSRSRLVDTLILREAKALGFVAEEYTSDE
jgi:hypothetical protein